MPLQCVLHVSGDANTVVIQLFPLNRHGKLLQFIAKARKKNTKEIQESWYMSIQSIPLIHYSFHNGCYSKFTVYPTESMKSVLMTVLLMPMLP